MNLKLEQYHLFAATEEINCDASKMFFDRRNKDCHFNFSDGCAIFYARFCKIFKGDEAVYLEVCDTETGELLQLNARKGMHNVCLKHGLYPPIILNVLMKK